MDQNDVERQVARWVKLLSGAFPADAMSDSGTSGEAHIYFLWSGNEHDELPRKVHIVISLDATAEYLRRPEADEDRRKADVWLRSTLESKLAAHDFVRDRVLEWSVLSNDLNRRR
jgi:hypothetical protein